MCSSNCNCLQAAYHVVDVDLVSWDRFALAVLRLELNTNLDRAGTVYRRITDKSWCALGQHLVQVFTYVTVCMRA